MKELILFFCWGLPFAHACWYGYLWWGAVLEEYEDILGLPPTPVVVECVENPLLVRADLSEFENRFYASLVRRYK